MTRNREAISTLEPTRYEVGLYDGQQLVKVLGYSVRQCKAVLMRYLLNHRQDVCKLHTGPENDCLAWNGKQRVLSLGNVHVKFTGKTEREAAKWKGAEIKEIWIDEMKALDKLNCSNC